METQLNALLESMNNFKNAYYDGLLASHGEEFIKSQKEHNEYTFTKGKKYIKILSHGSVVAFIDPEGNIYKPASWQAPAKGIRGNLFSEQGGKEAFNYHHGYGFVSVRYNRGGL